MATAQRIARTIAAECACLRSRGAARALSRRYDAELRPSGLRISQLTIVVGVAMFGADGAAITALADAISIERTTLTRNLQPLVREGLLRLDRHPDDARSRLVHLTLAGEAALAAAYPLWRRAQQATREALGDAETSALGAALDGVLSRFASEGGGEDD